MKFLHKTQLFFIHFRNSKIVQLKWSPIAKCLSQKCYVTQVGPTMYSWLLTAILLFIIFYMVVSCTILRLSFNECQFKSFRRFVTTGFLHVAVFSQIWRLVAEILQYRGNAFGYVGPTCCRHTPDKDQQG